MLPTGPEQLIQEINRVNAGDARPGVRSCDDLEVTAGTAH